MRVQTRKSVKNTRKLTKVAPESKDIKKTPLKGFAKGSVFNKSSIMSSSKSCNDSTDESDGECEEIPFVRENHYMKRKIFGFFFIRPCSSSKPSDKRKYSLSNAIERRI